MCHPAMKWGKWASSWWVLSSGWGQTHCQGPESLPCIMYPCISAEMFTRKILSFDYIIPYPKPWNSQLCSGRHITLHIKTRNEKDREMNRKVRYIWIRYLILSKRNSTTPKANDNIQMESKEASISAMKIPIILIILFQYY